MTTVDWLGSIKTDGDRIAALDPSALELPVPSCPGWTVRTGVVHTAGAHRWAGMFLRAGVDSRDRFSPDVSDAPDGADVLGWYRRVVDELLAELSRHDPDEPARAFIGRTTAQFWMRRMAQETSIHRWDLQNSLPGGAESIEPSIAADGITELTQLQIPLIVGKKRLPEEVAGTTMAIVATDSGDEWVLRLYRDRVEVVTGEQALGSADVTVRGNASDLDLVLWRRSATETVAVQGDRLILNALLSAVVI